MNDNHIKQSPMLSLLSLGGGSNGIILGGSLNPVIEAASSSDSLRPLKEGALPTTTICLASNIIATEVAILAAV